jgi:hypothetical protein
MFVRQSNSQYPVATQLPPRSETGLPPLANTSPELSTMYHTTPSHYGPIDPLKPFIGQKNDRVYRYVAMVEVFTRV